MFCTLARSIIESCDSFDLTASLAVSNTVLKPQSIAFACLIVGLSSAGERSFIVFLFGYLRVYTADPVQRILRVMWFSCCSEYLTLRTSRFSHLSVPSEYGFETFACFSVDRLFDPNG